MTNSDNAQNPEKKIVLQIYAVFAVSLILSTLPSMMAALASIAFVMGVLIAAYAIRKRADAHSLKDNHMTFIIRTIWIASFLAIVTLITGSAYMLSKMNSAPLNSCINQFLSMDPAAAASLNGLQIIALFEPCMNGFITENFNVLMISLAIAAGPILVYLLYRYIKGFERAIKGYRLAKPKAWF